MKLATFISRNFSKLLAISESSLKEILGYIRLFFVILLTLAIICKQILLHENEILQYLQDFQDCKRYNVDQDHFKKPL